MKILLLSQIYPQPDDTAGYVPTKTVAYFARDWVKSGHEVVVIHCQSRFPLPYYLIPDRLKKRLLKNSYALIPAISTRKSLERVDEGVRIYRLPMSKWVPSQAYSGKEMDKQVRRISEICEVNNFKPDIVAGHFANPCLELTARLGRMYNARTSFVFHNDCNERTIPKYRIEKYKGDIAVFGGRSERDAEKIKEMLGLDREPFVCYSGVPDKMVDNASKECNKNNNGNLIFMYAGGLVKKKRVDSVIKAFAQIKMKKADCTLRLVGAGPEKQYLITLAEQQGIEDSVSFMGSMTRDAVSAQMKEAHIFTMISENEVFGMVYLEAMLQGCIVIASKNGGFDGIIKDGKNGFLCNAGDEVMLADIYNKIINMSPDERNKIGNAAINTAISLSETKVAEHYLEEVCGDR